MLQMTLPGVLDKSPDVIKGDKILIFWNQSWFETMVTDVCGENVSADEQPLTCAMLESIRDKNTYLPLTSYSPVSS